MNISLLFRNCMLSVLSIFLLTISGCTGEKNSNCPASYVDLQIVAHWPDGATIPSGIRVVIYPEGVDSYIQADFPPEGGTISILTGKYSIIVLNNDSQKIIYSNKDSYTNHNASTSMVNVTLPNRPDITQCFVSPDNLWLASFDSYKVIRGKNVINVYPKNQVYQYYVVAQMTGIEYVQSAAGVVTNLKESIRLRTPEAVLTEGSVVLDATRLSTGVQFGFRSFGVVKAHSHQIAFMVNSASKTYEFNIDISAALNAIPYGGTIYLADQIEIEPDEIVGGDGFEVNLDDWKNIVVNLPPIIATPL